MLIHPPPNHAMLDVLCPMHVHINETGHITHVGPTLRKIRPGKSWRGQRFLEVFRVVRPFGVQGMDQMRDILGRKLRLELRDAPRTALKGIALRPDGAGSGYLVNLAFGISILDAVRDFDLTNADFAATDMTIEMLYLVEAKSAAMDATRKLNLRLHGAKLAAEEQAMTDTLTGLRNRRALDAALSRFIGMASPLAVMQIDLDFFKDVNDTLGHAAGDTVLLHVASVFKSLTRSSDVVARVGGDEFVILMPGSHSRKSLQNIGSRIIAALEEPVDFKGSACKISGSIGTTVWNGVTETTPDKLLDDADVALYASKAAGRSRQMFYDQGLRKKNQKSAKAKVSQ